MGALLVLIAGLIGAGLMYLLDPDQGKRRRELLRDQATSKVKDVGDTLQSKVQHTRKMAEGVVAEAKSHLEQDKEEKGEAVPIPER
jgi:gas vesicle protein